MSAQRKRVEALDARLRAEAARDPRSMFSKIPQLPQNKLNDSDLYDSDTTTVEAVLRRILDIKALRKTLLAQKPPANELLIENLDNRILALEHFKENLKLQREREREEEKKHDSPPKPSQRPPVSAPKAVLKLKPSKKKPVKPKKPVSVKKTEVKEANLLPHTRAREFVNIVVDIAGLNFGENGPKISRNFVLVINERLYAWIQAVMSYLLLIRDPHAGPRKTITLDEISAAIEAQNPGLTKDLEGRMHDIQSYAVKRKRKTSFIVRAHVRKAMKEFLHGRRVQVAAVDCVHDALFLRAFEVLSIVAKQLHLKKRVLFTTCPPFVVSSKTKRARSHAKTDTMNPLIELSDEDTAFPEPEDIELEDEDTEEEDDDEDDDDWEANNEDMNAEEENISVEEEDATPAMSAAIVDFDEEDSEAEDGAEGDATDGDWEVDNVTEAVDEMHIHTLE